VILTRDEIACSVTVIYPLVSTVKFDRLSSIAYNQKIVVQKFTVPDRV
jgi:hypothetical protein